MVPRERYASPTLKSPSGRSPVDEIALRKRERGWNPYAYKKETKNQVLRGRQVMPLGNKGRTDRNFQYQSATDSNASDETPTLLRSSRGGLFLANGSLASNASALNAGISTPPPEQKHTSAPQSLRAASSLVDNARAKVGYKDVSGDLAGSWSPRGLESSFTFNAVAAEKRAMEIEDDRSSRRAEVRKKLQDSRILIPGAVLGGTILDEDEKERLEASIDWLSQERTLTLVERNTATEVRVILSNLQDNSAPYRPFPGGSQTRRRSFVGDDMKFAWTSSSGIDGHVKLSDMQTVAMEVSAPGTFNITLKPARPGATLSSGGFSVLRFCASNPSDCLRFYANLSSLVNHGNREEVLL